ncbi:ParA family protein [Leptospira interrogans]|uniref:ParA family protein n=2 Tax=Leptospira interrogans TaxID=173 RepID=A0AAP9WFD6_LEPIR|nr:ParA family protein [Leptospira interrogans]MCL8312898.1 ParA family protein [Leptospira interrogans]QOI44940.1 ParA family protein [Leptospira interrogans serovar Canicola]UML82763.1 ParA family protein [Leptospira interrogans]
MKIFRKTKKRIISLLGHKGGIGKTICTTGLGQALAYLGFDVVLMDFEENNNLTGISLNNHPDFANVHQRNLYTAINGRHSLNEVVWKGSHHGCDVIPTTGKIQQLDFMLYSDRSLSIRLSEEIVKLEYDYIILDVHPSLNSTMRFAISVSDLILTPLQEDSQNADGIQRVYEEIKIISEESRRAIPILIVPNNISSSKEELMNLVAKGMGIKTTNSIIYNNEGIKNAKNLKQPLNPKSIGFSYFTNLAKEIHAL